MPLAPWSNDYLTGNAQVDDQHKQLFTLINELHHAVIQGHAREVLEPALRRLALETDQHFATEESLMLDAGYTGIERHRAKHDQLRRKIQELIDGFKREGQKTTAAELSQFMSDWLKHHIQGEDLRLIDWLKRLEQI